MPLLSVDLDAGTLDKICDCCGTIDTVALSGLVIGVGIPGRVNQNAIPMPVCSQCGAFETMFRTWDRIPIEYQDSPASEQKAAKNALAKHLISLGQQLDLAKPIHAAETEDPPVMMPLGDAVDLRVPHNDRVPQCAARNVQVASRAKNPRITHRGRNS